MMCMPFYFKLHNPALNRNIGKFNIHYIQDRVLLNTPGLKIKRHVHDIGHGQSTQPNTPMQFFIGSMEHAQRTPLSEHVHRTSLNIYKVLNFSSASDLMKSNCWFDESLSYYNKCSVPENIQTA